MMMNTEPKIRRGAKAAAALMAVSLLVAACGSGNSSSSASTDKAADPIAGRLTPTDKKPTEQVKIGVIGFSNNPYWVSVKSGADYANRVLASRNGKVTWIVAGANIDVATVSSGIQGAVAQGYQGVGFFIAGEGNCQDIKTQTAKGIKLAAYNTLFPCVETSGGVINYAQEQYKAGQLAAAEMIKAVGDKAGTVGIITSQFTAPGAEQRRKGFIEGLKGSKVTTLGAGVEAKDSAGNTFTAAQNYMQSSSDLVGIYATAGGPFGAAEAVAAAKKEASIKVIGYDVTPENIKAIKDGSMYGVIGQDAFGQGYNLAIALFNSVVTGEKASPVSQEAKAPFVTKANIAEHDPSSLPIGTLGAS